jgi:hypothetical protein
VEIYGWLSFWFLPVLAYGGLIRFGIYGFWTFMFLKNYEAVLVVKSK